MKLIKEEQEEKNKVGLKIFQRRSRKFGAFFIALISSLKVALSLVQNVDALIHEFFLQLLLVYRWYQQHILPEK
jgi:hypothetical protein